MYYSACCLLLAERSEREEERWGRAKAGSGRKRGSPGPLLFSEGELGEEKYT